MWFGIIGLVNRDDEARYIYDEKYEMQKLKAIHLHLNKDADPTYEINPAFWAALEVDNV